MVTVETKGGVDVTRYRFVMGMLPLHPLQNRITCALWQGTLNRVPKGTGKKSPKRGFAAQMLGIRAQKIFALLDLKRYWSVRCKKYKKVENVKDYAMPFLLWRPTRGTGYYRDFTS